jgi:ketosteroid isomerase-like protein
MEQPETDAVRRFYAAWSAGDLQGMLAEVDPDVEAQPVLGLLYERPSYKGHSGITRWFEEATTCGTASRSSSRRPMRSTAR